MKFGGGGREGGREIGGVARMVERLLLTPQPSREPKKVLPSSGLQICQLVFYETFKRKPVSAVENFEGPGRQEKKF